MPLVLERQAFPFTGPFERDRPQELVAQRRRLQLQRLAAAAQRAPARRRPDGAARHEHRAHGAHDRARDDRGVRASAGRRVRFSGTVSPELSGARASLQRRKRGRFVTLRRVQLRPPGAATRSQYRMTIAARRTAAFYRVVVTPSASSGHARGVSDLRHVAGLKRR